jgi:hypothetical protein
MRQISINDLYSRYVSGEIKRGEFEGNLYAYLVNNQDKTCLSHWKNDEYEDYVSWFYPSLKRAIDSYNETGSSFEAFMHKFLLISSKEYHVRITTRSVIEYSAWSARVPELYTREEAPVYLHEKTESVIQQLIIDKKGRKNTRRILALILKCYHYVSEDFLDKISDVIGIDKNELREMVMKIRRLRQKRDDEIYQMKERIYRQYYRCIIYEKRLLLLKENTLLYNKMFLRLEKARQRLEKMRARISKIRTDASNKQVADIIGIKKGTVDSSLFKLKAKWEIMAAKSDLN